MWFQHAHSQCLICHITCLFVSLERLKALKENKNGLFINIRALACDHLATAWTWTWAANHEMGFLHITFRIKYFYQVKGEAFIVKGLYYSFFSSVIVGLREDLKVFYELKSVKSLDLLHKITTGSLLNIYVDAVLQPLNVKSKTSVQKWRTSAET